MGLLGVEPRDDASFKDAAYACSATGPIVRFSFWIRCEVTRIIVTNDNCAVGGWSPSSRVASASRSVTSACPRLYTKGSSLQARVAIQPSTRRVCRDHPGGRA